MNRLSAKVLLTSAAAKLPLIRALEQTLGQVAGNRLWLGDSDGAAVSSKIGLDFWIMPKLIQENASDLIQGCLDRGINFIFPTRDGELEFWAKNSAEFSRHGIFVLVSELEAVRLCLDKLSFSAFGKLHDLPIIESSLVLEDVEGESIVVKERFGAGSKSIGLNLDRNQALNFAKRLQDPIFQPYFSGREISVDAWANAGGVIVGLVLRSRDLVREGESQVTTTFRHLGIEEQVKQFLTAISKSHRLFGPMVLQGLIQSDERLEIIELNARFGGASTASLQVGLDSILWSLQAAGFGLPSKPFARSDFEVRQVRHSADLYVKMP